MARHPRPATAIADHLAEHPQATVPQIVRATGVSRRTVYRYIGCDSRRAKKTVSVAPPGWLHTLVKLLADPSSDVLTRPEVANEVEAQTGHRPHVDTITRYRQRLQAADPSPSDIDDPDELHAARMRARRRLARLALQARDYETTVAGAALGAGPGRPRTREEELGELRRRAELGRASRDTAQRAAERAQRAEAERRDLEQLVAAVATGDDAAVRRTRWWRQYRVMQIALYRLLTPDDMVQLRTEGILESEDATWELDEGEVEALYHVHGAVTDAVWAHYDNRYRDEGHYDRAVEHARAQALARGLDEDDAAEEAAEWAEVACVDWTQEQMVGLGRLPIAATAIRTQGWE